MKEVNLQEALFFEQIAEHIAQQLPFVVYRKPNTSQCKAFLQTESGTNYTTDFEEEGFVFAPFVIENGCLLIPKQKASCLETTLHPSPVSQKKAARSVVQKGRETHVHLVEKALQEIEKTSLQKVVLSRDQEVQKETVDVLAVFRRMLQAYATAFVYCWFHPVSGCWLGASPETLVQLENKQLKTMALAGTQKYVGTVEVQWGEKERKEQQWVTDAILENLEEKIDGLQVSDTYTARAGSLLHLKTDISGRLTPEFSLSDVVKALHPTPAVCGFPKEMAKDFILKNEGYSRAFYTGFVGELNLKEKLYRNSRRRNQENRAYAHVKKRSHLFVNLRCMKIENERLHVYVGGGITSASKPEDEWQETINKTQTMLSVL